MNCKKCGRFLNRGEKFCPFCGYEVKTKDFVTQPFVLSIISFIIFLIILITAILCMFAFYNNDSGAEGWFIIILIFIAGVPFLISFILSVMASDLLKKYRQFGLDIPKKLKTLVFINKFQIPFIILVLIFGFILKDYKYKNFINQKLNELYDSKYKIIDSCSVSNEAGTNYDIVVLKLDDFDYPVFSRFDWANDEYEDDYNELKQADSLGYHAYINSVFNNEVVSLMNFSNEEKYKQITLSILLTTEDLDDKDNLKTKVKQITNKYVEEFSDYNFSFRIYFTKEIDMNLIQNYYIYLSGNNSCGDDLNKKVISLIVNSIYIYIDDDTDIDYEINDSFYNMH